MNRASSPTGWVRNPDGTLGWTCNPLTGCRNCTPEGLCLGGSFPCYAYKLANGRLKQRYLANENYPEQERYQRVPFYPRFWNERLKELTRRNDMLWADDIERTRARPKNTKPIGIFLCDMGDLFGIGVPREWTEKILNEVWGNKGYDRFYVLTKQGQNLHPWSPFPPNCWVGVTATNRQMLLEARKVFDSPICSAGIKAKIKYISFEPLLEPVICDHKWETDTHQPAFSRRRIMPTPHCVKCGQDKRWGSNSELIGSDGKPIVDQVIIGACTGTLNDLKPLALKYPELTLMPYGVEDPELPFTRGKKWTLQPRIEWVEEIVRARDKAGVKVFLKDNLLPMFQAEWSKKFDKEIWDGERLRQELPVE